TEWKVQHECGQRRHHLLAFVATAICFYEHIYRFPLFWVADFSLQHMLMVRSPDTQANNWWLCFLLKPSPPPLRWPCTHRLARRHRHSPKIYNVSCERYFGFGCEIDGEISDKLEGNCVLFVLPDSYVDAENKDYGGKLTGFLRVVFLCFARYMYMIT
ncbi:unnamed protein product, partial [Musa hybrid cultivar]